MKFILLISPELLFSRVLRNLKLFKEIIIYPLALYGCGTFSCIKGGTQTKGIRNDICDQKGECRFFKMLSKPIEKRLPENPSRIWEGNIRVNFREMFVNMRNRTVSAQETDYWSVCGIEPPGSINH